MCFELNLPVGLRPSLAEEFLKVSKAPLSSHALPPVHDAVCASLLYLEVRSKQEAAGSRGSELVSCTVRVIWTRFETRIEVPLDAKSVCTPEQYSRQARAVLSEAAGGSRKPAVSCTQRRHLDEMRDKQLMREARQRSGARGYKR